MEKRHVSREVIRQEFRGCRQAGRDAERQGRRQLGKDRCREAEMQGCRKAGR